VFLSGFALSPRVQRERELLNCAMYVMPEEPEDTAVHAARRLRSGQGQAMHDVRTLLGSPMELAQAAKRRQVDGLPPIPPPKRVVIGANSEQRPDPNSRITLSEHTDALGMPLSRVDWRMDDQELATITTMLDLVRAELARNGLPVPKPHAWLDASDWRSNFVDTAHHSSSVRMSNDPSTGVTDGSGHVFGVDGLFVAGSALFPTVGTANPTLMLTAMAIKVADAVRRRHQEQTSSPAVDRRPAPSTAPVTRAEPERRPTAFTRSNPCRVGLVGSGHRAESLYLPAVAALGNAEVVGFTSRSDSRRQAFSEICGAPGYDDADALVAATRPDLLVVAVGRDANESMTRHLLAAGIPMLVETPWAWSVGQGRDLLSAVGPHAVIGVAEQFPFLPLEQLRARIINDGVLGQIQVIHNDSATWDYHSVAQLRRYLGPMTRPTSVLASSFAPLLAGPEDLSPQPRQGYSATITCDNGAVVTQRFINFYDPPLRFHHHLAVDGELGSMVDDEVRYLDRSTGEVVAATIERIEKDGTLAQLSIDLGALGVLEWTNPYGHTSLTDEQISVATHLSAMVRASADHGSPLYSPADALDDIEIMNAIGLSATRGRKVSLPVKVKREKLRKAATPEYVQANAKRVVGKFRTTLRR
jgi:predicted dehydrogenase